MGSFMGRNGGADPSLMIVCKTKKALGLTHDGFKILVEPSGIQPMNSMLTMLSVSAAGMCDVTAGGILSKVTLLTF
jgi:hypothetical protein